MDEINKQLAALAFDTLRTNIKHTKDNHALFKALLTISVEGNQLPVLLVGAAHGLHEDGEAIAMLNPEPDLYEKIHGGTAYSGGLLNEYVSGKCDGMVHVWLDAYKKPENQESILDSYSPRTRAAEPRMTFR